MARTPLLNRVEDAVGCIAAEEAGITRREIVKRAAVAGVGLTLLGRFAPVARGATTPRVAIVGGGLAGLTAALRLKQAGVNATIYEASIAARRPLLHGSRGLRRGTDLRARRRADRQRSHRHEAAHAGARSRPRQPRAGRGGRNRDARVFRRTSVQRRRDDRRPEDDLATAPQGHLGGELSHDLSELDAARASARPALDRSDGSTSTSRAGSTSQLGQMLDVAYNIEYGAETTDQSSLNMLYLLGYVGPGQFRTFGKSNEKFHVRGGNDLVVTRMAQQLDGQIEVANELVGHRLHERWRVHADVPRRLRDEDRDCRSRRARAAVLDPASRRHVEGRVSARLKIRAIRELGMGTNSKLHLQFKQRFWADLGSNGETYSDRGYQSSWEVSRSQGGTSGILVDYTGGTIGAELRQRHRPRRARRRSWASWSRSCPVRRPSGTGGPRSTTGRATSGRVARIRTSRSASTPRSPESRASGRETATSQASTPRRTRRGTSTAPSRPGNAPPRISSSIYGRRTEGRAASRGVPRLVGRSAPCPRRARAPRAGRSP